MIMRTHARQPLCPAGQNGQFAPRYLDRAIDGWGDRRAGMHVCFYVCPGYSVSSPLEARRRRRRRAQRLVGAWGVYGLIELELGALLRRC